MSLQGFCMLIDLVYLAHTSRWKHTGGLLNGGRRPSEELSQEQRVRC
jgi:hypothetical protein